LIQINENAPPIAHDGPRGDRSWAQSRRWSSGALRRGQRDSISPPSGIHRHPLVAGQPIQVNDGKRAWLEVPLTTGGRIACDAESGYRLVSALEIVRR